MSDYVVTLERSPSLSDAELSGRLAAAYRIIVKAAHRAQRKAAEGQARAEGEG